MAMMTPELVNEESGEFVLVANHFIGTQEFLEMSIAFNRARISFAAAHLPTNLEKCILIYDVRGQMISNKKVKVLREAFSDIFEIRILS